MKTLLLTFIVCTYLSGVALVALASVAGAGEEIRFARIFLWPFFALGILD